jgi:hypothetical protein
MGLIINSTENKKIQSKDFDGNITEVESIYARLEFAGRPNGTTIEVAFPYIFKSKQGFQNGASQMPTDLSVTNAVGEIALGTMQGNAEAHRIAAEKLEAEGYDVTIDLE